MTIAQVETIVGEAGDIATVSGPPFGDPAPRVDFYRWQNDDGSYGQVDVHDDVVVSKSADRLK